MIIALILTTCIKATCIATELGRYKSMHPCFADLAKLSMVPIQIGERRQLKCKQVRMTEVET